MRSVPAQAAPPAEHGESKWILLVDDDSLICGLVSATLEDAGYEIKTAANGYAAWAALLAGGYDLLITSDTTPKVSGLALVRRIRVADMALPVIVTSASLNGGDAAELNRDPWARFDALVRKPFTMSEMLTTVQSVLPAV